MFSDIYVNITILISATLIIIMMGSLFSIMKIKILKDKVDGFDDYDYGVNPTGMQSKINKSKIVNIIGGKSKNESELIKIFDNSKNPWGITPTIFRFIRTGSLISGVVMAIFFSAFLLSHEMALLMLFFGAVGWWYPMYYYKAIAKEREAEWDKIYEFIWVIKNSALMYDAKQVCLESKNYIEENSPHYTEIIDGLSDFHKHWEDHEIPQYILRHYNFGIAKELYTILYQMNETGVYPDASLDNLRYFSVTKHSKSIGDSLSKVPSKATLAILPFLMLSVIVAIIVPMVTSLIQMM